MGQIPGHVLDMTRRDGWKGYATARGSEEPTEPWGEGVFELLEILVLPQHT